MEIVTSLFKWLGSLSSSFSSFSNETRNYSKLGFLPIRLLTELKLTKSGQFQVLRRFLSLCNIKEHLVRQLISHFPFSKKKKNTHACSTKRPGTEETQIQSSWFLWLELLSICFSLSHLAAFGPLWSLDFSKRWARYHFTSIW